MAAHLRRADLPCECRLIGVNRKSFADRQTTRMAPKRTSPGVCVVILPASVGTLLLDRIQYAAGAIHQSRRRCGSMAACCAGAAALSAEDRRDKRDLRN